MATLKVDLLKRLRFLELTPIEQRPRYAALISELEQAIAASPQDAESIREAYFHRLEMARLSDSADYLEQIILLKQTISRL